jgi:hypothetical protein
MIGAVRTSETSVHYDTTAPYPTRLSFSKGHTVETTNVFSAANITLSAFTS